MNRKNMKESKLATVLVQSALAKVGNTVAGHEIMSVGSRKTLYVQKTCLVTSRTLLPGNYRLCEIKVN